MLGALAKASLEQIESERVATSLYMVSCSKILGSLYIKKILIFLAKNKNKIINFHYSNESQLDTFFF